MVRCYGCSNSDGPSRLRAPRPGGPDQTALVGAPVLIDAKVSRNFLEQAQSLGGEMARALGVTATAPGQAGFSATRLDDAVQRLRAASTPLLQVLDPETRVAVSGADSG